MSGIAICLSQQKHDSRNKTKWKCQNVSAKQTQLVAFLIYAIYILHVKYNSFGSTDYDLLNISFLRDKPNWLLITSY